MSCGDEHETNCNEVLAEVWLFLDKECDQARRDLLSQHLDECNPCLAAYGLEEKLKKLLARKCGGEQAPNTLRARLRDQIRAAMAEQARVTVEEAEVRVEHRDGHASIEIRHSRVERR